LRYFIELAYNGKQYHGWQRQPNALAVQEVVEGALALMLNTETELVGAGRTDAGVHARQLFAHFDAVIIDKKALMTKLNSFLPKDIVIKNIFEVPEAAHARFHAVARSYEYVISSRKDPFMTDFAYFFKKELRVDLMNEACEVLFNYENFKCFSKSKTDVKTYNCTITKAVWKKQGDHLVFHIAANRFLRNMVRAIVGTCIEVGLEKMTLNEFHQVIESEDRSRAGASVPGHGLYLTKVSYPDTLFST
jgi:tRNA pseudouridine38-40 synthase